MCTGWKAEPGRSPSWHRFERNWITKQFICACAKGQKPVGKTVNSLLIFSFFVQCSGCHRTLKSGHKHWSFSSNGKTSILPCFYGPLCPLSFDIFRRQCKDTFGDKGQMNVLSLVSKPLGLMKTMPSRPQSETLPRLKPKDIKHGHSRGEGQIMSASGEAMVTRSSQSALL